MNPIRSYVLYDLFVRPTIERLPLGGNIDKVVGGVHPRLEDEISRGRQMASRQKQASALALLMLILCYVDMTAAMAVVVVVVVTVVVMMVVVV